ncbi:hypothetical protein ON010_g12984 [Phytophthora cinnamomi]|nr:hypothetical protein ON010_g12984 [Phytophthora cinnamomi]
MRAILVVMLAATAQTSCSDATSSATESKMATNRVLPGGPSVLGAGRFLRAEVSRRQRRVSDFRLRQLAPDSELTKIVIAGMKSTDDLTQATADRLRARQLGTWLRYRKDPRDVYQLFRGGGVRAQISDVNRVRWMKYLNAFNVKYVKIAA